MKKAVLLVFLLLLCSPFISAVTLRLAVRDVYTNTNLTSFCINATGSNTSQFQCTTNGQVSFTTTGTYNITAYYINSSATASNNYCYQETANVSTACGGLNTGAYGFSSLVGFQNSERLYDGDWTTSGKITASRTFFVNYTVPWFARSGNIWQIGGNFSSPYNALNTTFNSINETLAQGTLIHSLNGIGDVTLDYGGGSEIFPTKNDTITEEAVYWNINSFSVSPYFTVNLANFVFSNNANVTLNTTQAVINISAYRLFLNTSIASFNITNGPFTNTSGTMIGAVNGTNNIKVDVAGNFSKNVTCVVNVPLTVTSCSVTGIYDALLRIGATNGSAALNNFSVTVINSSLGGLLYNQSSGNNVSINLSVLQGFTYDLNITKDSLRFNSTSRTISTLNDTYNATLIPLTVFLTFREEQNRTLLSSTNVQFTVISSNGTETSYNTTSGQSTISGTLPPGDYTIRYGASGYSSRDYYFSLSYQVENLTLYLISSSVYTPGVVEVRDYDTRLVQGAIIKLHRYYGNASIANIVQMATSGTDGSALMTAEAITAFYTWEVIVHGVTRFNTSTPELLAIQSDGLWHRTFALNPNASQVQHQESGIVYDFTPDGSLTNGSTVVFGFNATSDYWNVTSCSVLVTNVSNGAILGSNTSYCNTTTGPVVAVVLPDDGSVRLTGTIVTEAATLSYTTSYTVLSVYETGFTLADLVTDIRNFNKGGFDDTSRLILSAILVCLGVWGATSTFETFNNPENAMIFVFGMVVLLSYGGFLYMNSVPFPVEALKQYMIALLIGMLTAVYVLRRHLS